MENCPFISQDPRYARDRKFDLCAFARAIAEHLTGWTVETTDEHRSYPMVRLISCDGKAIVNLRNGYGAKFGKIEFGDYHLDSGVLEPHQRDLGVGNVTVDGTRDVEKIAADVNRRLLSKLPAAIKVTNDRIAARAATADALAQRIADLAARFPGLSFNRRDANALHADVYYNHAGRYLTGSIDADGRLSIQRLSLNTDADAVALFELVARS